MYVGGGGRRLFGLHRSQGVAALGGAAGLGGENLVVTMDRVPRVSSCFVPEPQENTWYAPMVFYKRYKHLGQVYKRCSILRLREFCSQFRSILDCPKNQSSGEVVISSQGKEASTIFATLVRPAEEGRFELFRGCVYELGRRSSLRVRCLHSNKVDSFPLKVVVKVDGRTDDFLYHFNHELIVYSRIASSTYGASRVRLHPSIYSVFLQPGRKIISRGVLLMEYIEGPAISSIISELTNYPGLLKYLKNRVSAVLEESVRVYDSKLPSLRSDEKITVESRARLLENFINSWVASYADRTMAFSVNLYRRLLYLLDLFHRGGTSFYPEELQDFSRGKWKASRSFRIHCDFHQGNILVKVSDKFKGEVSDVYNLTYKDMLDIDLYRDLKIIDLEDAVELKESDFPVSVDRLVGTHPCPVYLTDAEGFSARLLSNVILISSTLIQSLRTLQDFFSGQGTKSLVFENKVVSDWITGDNPERRSELDDFSFRLKDSTLKKLEMHSQNWDRYVDLIKGDDVLKPCISYYYIKFGRKPPPKSQLPCSWLSNILFSRRACRYLELSHGTPNPFRQKSEDEDQDLLEAELLGLSNATTKCHIDETEALQISVNNVSSRVDEFLPAVSDVNETSWGEWAVLFKSQGSGGILSADQQESLRGAGSAVNATGAVSTRGNETGTSNETGIAGTGNLTIASSSHCRELVSNSNSKKVLDQNLLPCSNHLSEGNSKSNFLASGNKATRRDKTSVFGSLDVLPRDKSPSNVPDWVEMGQVVGGNDERGKTASLREHGPSSESSSGNATVSQEFDRILVELMGLAALQRIISFCSKFSQEIDCDNVTSSKITRDGPISSYVVRTLEGFNSTGRDSEPGFVKFLDPCVLHSEASGSSFTGWLCPYRSRSISENVFKIVADGRLFLDANRTFVGQNNHTFAFQDVLGYFGVNETSNYTSEFNQEAVSIIERHKRDALEFWKLESKIRNMDSMLRHQDSLRDVGDSRSSQDSALPQMFVFHSGLSTEKVQARVVVSSPDRRQSVVDGQLHFLPLSGKRSDLSKQISSVVQVGLLSENVFFIVSPSTNRVSSLVSKVANFHNEVFSMVWISYPTLVLSVIESVLRSHSYQTLVSFRALEFLHALRSERDFDISMTAGSASRPGRVEILTKSDSTPVICNFSLKKVIIQPKGSSGLLKLFGELNKFTLYNTSGVRFMRRSEQVAEACSHNHQLTDKSDIQTLIRDLVLPSLDPISSLNKAVESLSKVKFNSSVEVRRSNWFVKHVCSFLSRKLLETTSDSHTLPALVQSLLLMISSRDRISSDPTFSKCVKAHPQHPPGSPEFAKKCTVGEYISISEAISSELLRLFARQSHLFENSTSLDLAQDLISFVNQHLQIPPPPPEDPPPPGGLGHLFRKSPSGATAGLEHLQNSSNLLYDRNSTIAFDIRWPIIANVSGIINSDRNLTSPHKT